ncbi:hypothetical protein F7734_29985 [Scytonema sp. UIC 10036]|uniref:hypothetical protein n=1 Tax=Scytonema sp. UIC 10036 TaxID=2304196 RepID=UPI0012DA5EB2|nr:hypothetical protein [Scytonema sp. UIC 10036]MUG96344.1 hypothetical protein [Scytonema sp. UIC 10036]
MQRTETNALKNILDYLPERIRQAIEEYSQQSQLSSELVIEKRERSVPRCGLCDF